MGSTGLFLALLGLIPLATTMPISSPTAWGSAISRFLSELPSLTFTNRFQAISLAMIGIGGAMFLLSLVVQVLGGVRTVAGRGNMAATNSAVQIVLVAVLLIGVNAWSFRHYWRLDWTRNQQFTLPSNITSELAKLRGQTDIIVYQRHKTFGRLSDKPDAYDYAAERKVVEKVQDLVEQFREFGPQFRVEVLDIESEGYETRLEALTQDAPVLRTALDAAPENSIFFHARRQFGAKADGKPDFRENVQRLSFNEFYELDKTDSLGKSVIVLFEKRADKNEDQNLAAIERKVRRLVDPDAPDGPDIKLFVIRSDDANAAKVREQTAAEAPALKPLLEAAAKDRNAENSIFVFKDAEPSQLPFATFAALSDAAGRDALRPRGNLVLVPQGIASFARKVLAVEERPTDWMNLHSKAPKTPSRCKASKSKTSFSRRNGARLPSLKPPHTPWTKPNMTGSSTILPRSTRASTVFPAEYGNSRLRSNSFAPRRSTICRAAIGSNSAAGRSPRNCASARSPRSRPICKRSITSSSRIAKPKSNMSKRKSHSVNKRISSKRGG
jgi:hypothetical protein